MKLLSLALCLTLLTGCLPEENKSGRHEIKTVDGFVFSIDTVTGDVWRLVQLNEPLDEKKFVGWYWSPMLKFETAEEERIYNSFLKQAAIAKRDSDLNKVLSNPPERKAPEK